MRLDVSANRLSVVDVPSLRGLDRLDELDAADNPFDCSGCQQLPFVRWLNRSVGLRLDRHKRLLCAGPPPLAGPSIFDVVPADCPRVDAAAASAAWTNDDRGSGSGGRMGDVGVVLLATGLVGLVVVVVSMDHWVGGTRRSGRRGCRHWWWWSCRSRSPVAIVACFRGSSRCTAFSTGRCDTARCPPTSRRRPLRTIRSSMPPSLANTSREGNGNTDNEDVVAIKRQC